MTVLGTNALAPYSKIKLSNEAAAAGDTNLPVHFVNDTNTGIRQPAASPGVMAFDAAGTEAVRCTANGIQVLAGTAAASGGAAAGTTPPGIVISSASPPLGIFWGSGAPTFTAAVNSLYLRTDGSSTSTRIYVSGSTTGTWTNATTAT